MSDGGLYRTLEVDALATPAELRDAHKRLIRRYHPDKTQEASHESIGHCIAVQRAYDVLRHPGRRRLYDLLGEEGVQLTEGTYGDLWAEAATDPRLLRSGSLSASAGIVCALAFVLLLCAAEGRGWLLPVVFAPVWCADVLVVVLAAELHALTVRTCVDRGGLADERRRRVRYLCTAGLFTLWTLMLCAAASGHLPWSVALAPVAACELYRLQCNTAAVLRAVAVLLTGCAIDGLLPLPRVLPLWIPFVADAVTSARARCSSGGLRCIAAHPTSICGYVFVGLSLLLLSLYVDGRLRLAVAMAPTLCLLCAALLFVSCLPLLLQRTFAEQHRRQSQHSRPGSPSRQYSAEHSYGTVPTSDDAGGWTVEPD